MNRATWSDIEPVSPSNWGSGGGYRIFCAGGCKRSKELGYISVWGHRYIFHTKTKALAAWREAHPRENGENK